MKRVAAAVAVGVLGLGGCVESALDPDAKVALTGSALDEDKSPLANAELVMRRSANSQCLFTSEFARLQTDAAGAYQKELTGAETQKDEIARCFEVWLPDGAGGAKTWAEFLVQVEQVSVPTVQRWKGALAAQATNTGAEVSFTDLSQSHGLSGLAFTASVTSEGLEIWSTGGVASPVALSDEVLEDFASPVAALRTRSEKKGSGTTFTLHYTSDQVSVPTRKKVPVSRGASCTYPSAPSACPLTDGKLAGAGIPSDATEVRISLASPKVIRKVVLRGFSGPTELVLQGSLDGSAWTKLADVGMGSSFRELELPSSTGALKEFRFVRTDGKPLDLVMMSEVSLYE